MAVADLPEPRVMASMDQAMANIRPHFWWLLLFGVLAFFAGLLDVEWTFGSWPQVPTTPYAYLLPLFVGIPLAAGLAKAHLAASRGEKPTWSDLGYAFGPRYLESVALGALAVVMVVVGLALFVLPGVYVMVGLSFAFERFVTDELGPVEAIKASFADVKGRWWSVFSLWLAAVLLAMAGSLAFGVGVFFAMVLVRQAYVVYWRAATDGRTVPATFMPVAGTPEA